MTQIVVKYLDRNLLDMHTQAWGMYREAEKYNAVH